ncbi:glycosyltransferase family 4 protein [Rhodonellum sp.]|uniref:glycosyltransferase family 4 protein n=1 Tax=Rhodonellum sp. TaxID=2231180 RepID=UPI002716C0B9|nr:glycosyltransferase family 4 protein [Rhodonellum sp.]MDO9551117.1 glycosyltransferase family 4 protein [Rhodonellum sp.]
MKHKGIYLITEPGCLDTDSGANHHIRTGFSQLSQQFEILFFIRDSKADLRSSDHSLNTSSLNSSKTILNKGSILKGSIIDLITLFKNLFYIFKLVNNLKNEKASFIYERKAYLNPTGLIAAKILKIPHFYEANGLQFQRMEKYYSSFFNPMTRILEKWTYSFSDHVFFVGTYGNYWKLKSKNWSNIENGIEDTHLKYFDKHSKVFEDDIHICFIARLMSHHRQEILIQCLQSVANKNIHLHLIGSGLEEIEEALGNIIKVTNYGYKDREAIKPILKMMHIGIIPGSPEFTSTMKIFDYGSAKCAVIGPDITNFKFWFSDKIAFFKKNDATDFARVLNVLLKDKTLVIGYGVKIFQHISENFTWNKVYEKVTCKMIVEIDKTK